MSTEERIAKAESEDVEMTNGDALENVEEEDIEDQEE